MKIKILSNYKSYKKDQIVELAEKEAMPLLTNGKAIRVRKEKEEDPKPKKEKDKKLKDNV
jgi:hypothetical protein